MTPYEFINHPAIKIRLKDRALLAYCILKYVGDRATSKKNVGVDGLARWIRSRCSPHLRFEDVARLFTYLKKMEVVSYNENGFIELHQENFPKIAEKFSIEKKEYKEKREKKEKKPQQGSTSQKNVRRHQPKLTLLSLPCSWLAIVTGKLS